MCGRYTQRHSVHEIVSRFNLEANLNNLAPRFNIAPGQMAPIIINQGKKSLDFFQWGLIPSWAKDKSIGNKMINARAETIEGKPTFNRNFKKRRALVLGDGFFEWQKEDNGKSKTPYFFELKSKELFAFAALWDRWISPEGGEVKSFAIITIDANELVKKVHERMPAILKMEDEEKWLDPDIEPHKLLPLLFPYPAEAMVAYPVSRLVNSPKNDLPDCVKPIGG